MFESRDFQHFALRHRHIGDGLGISIFLATQNFKAKTGGLPLAIRDNTTAIMLFRTKNNMVLKGVMDEVSDDVTPEEFMAAYELATSQGDHDFLFLEYFPQR